MLASRLGNNIFDQEMAGLALAGAAGHLAGVALGNFWLALIAKPIPVLCLMAWVSQSKRDRYTLLIMIGLVCSALGDVFMGLPKQYLLAGMGAFALAHMAYVLAYLRKCTELRLAYLVPFVIWCGGVYFWLGDGMGALRIPVILYMAVIAVMMWRAFVWFKAEEGLAAYAFFGALVFALSDTLIAITLFSGPFSNDHYYIIMSYWFGQFLIARSAISGERVSEENL